MLSLTTRVLEGTHHRQRELESETTLSPQEAAVIALKEQGLTHKGVVLTMGLGQGQPGVADGDRLSPSTIDEYARRAREKYHKARRTADELDSVFS